MVIDRKVEILFEEKLSAARLELLSDRRLHDALHGNDQVGADFLLQLIQQKVAAAALSGAHAVEATLRLEAADRLQEAGASVEEIRKTLEEAKAALFSLKPRKSYAVPTPAFPPNVAAIVTFVIGLTLISLVYLAFPFSRFLFACLVLFLGAGAFLVRRYLKQQTLTQAEHVARKIPAELCQDYLEALELALDEYKRIVLDAEQRVINDARRKTML